MRTGSFEGSKRSRIAVALSSSLTGGFEVQFLRVRLGGERHRREHQPFVSPSVSAMVAPRWPMGRAAWVVESIAV